MSLSLGHSLITGIQKIKLAGAEKRSLIYKYHTDFSVLRIHRNDAALAVDILIALADMTFENL